MAIPQPQEWISAYSKIQKATDQQILQVLRSSLSDVNRHLAEMAAAERRGIGLRVREEQLLAVKRKLLAEQGAIFRKLGDVVRARQLEAASRAISLGSAVDSAILERAGLTGQARALKTVALGGADRTLEIALTRMQQSAFPLAERIYRTEVWMDGRLEGMVNSALARGLSAKEFGAEARDWFSPNTPGGVRYASMRLARSEINNAFHAVSVNHSAEKPWINAMKWHLSRSHPKPDDCDKYAHGGPHGGGVYPVKDVPRKPHPHCFCYVTPEAPDEDEFLDALVGGKYDKYLNEKMGRPAGTPAAPGPAVATELDLKGKAYLQKSLAEGKKAETVRRGLVKNHGLTERQADEVYRKAWSAHQGGARTATPAVRPTVTPRPVARPVTPVARPATPVARTPVARPATPRPAPVTPAPVPARATAGQPSLSEVAKAKTHAERITSGLKGKELDDTIKALHEQATFTPHTMQKLGSVRKMDRREAESFESRFGKEVLGGYGSGADMAIHPSTLKPAMEREFKRDLKSGWFSKCGHDHSGYDSFIAHEYGHHVDHVMSNLGTNAKREVWDVVGKELGIKPSHFYDVRSLDQWVARNKDLVKEKVSGYGATTSGEMLAEVWAEYTTNPNARPHIKAIGKAMQDLAERSASR